MRECGPDWRGGREGFGDGVAAGIVFGVLKLEAAVAREESFSAIAGLGSRRIPCRLF